MFFACYVVSKNKFAILNKINYNKINFIILTSKIKWNLEKFIINKKKFLKIRN